MADQQHRDKDQQNYLIDQARTIRDEIEVSVFGPAGHTPPCAEAWLTAKLIAELLHRIEALEAPQSGSIDLSHLSDAEREKILKLLANPGTFEVLEVAQPAKPNHPEKPDSSLVEQVAAAIHPNVCADPNLYLHEARAAIRAVAAWLREQKGYGHGWAMRLEQEAER
jgi:hypothetical protein